MDKKSNPWIEIKNMRDEMDRIMSETMNLRMKSGRQTSRLSLWQPVADLYETGQHLVLEIELPGVFQENINLEVQSNQLMVYGEKILEKEASGAAYQMLERSYGPFSRVFMLPDWIETSEINAVFKDGILRISMPKTSRQKEPLSITISGS